MVSVQKLLFVIFAQLLLPLNLAMAASVVKVIKRKGYVIINLGLKHNVDRGDMFCIHSSRGKKIACGVVKKSRIKKSSLRIRRSQIRKIRRGMKVVRKRNHYANPKGPWAAVKALYMPLTPVAYNQVYYIPQEEVSDILWQGDQRLASGTGIAGEMGLNLGMPVTIGARYVLYTEVVTAEQQFTSSAKADQFVEINQKAQSLGFWVDFDYVKFNKGPLQFRLGNGVDLDANAVRVSSAAKTSTGGEALTVDFASTTMVLSARAKADVEMAVNRFRFGLGAVGFLPLLALNNSTKSFFEPAADPNFADYDNENLEIMMTNALGHGKATFGLGLSFRASYSF